MMIDANSADALSTALSTASRWSIPVTTVGGPTLSNPRSRFKVASNKGSPRIDRNCFGLLSVDRALVPGMVRRAHGTVIHIGSIAGHQTYPGGNVYCATKHAVRALTDGLRQDLLGSGVRVLTVDPGMVDTEFSEVRFHGDRRRAEAVYSGLTPLSAEDVADVVVFAATRPPHVSLAQVLLLPTDQASTTQVHRRRRE